MREGDAAQEGDDAYERVKKGAWRMADLILISVLVTLVGLAIGYIVKAKRSGVKCIGCPADGGCGGGCGGCSCGGA